MYTIKSYRERKIKLSCKKKKKKPNNKKNTCIVHRSLFKAIIAA